MKSLLKKLFLILLYVPSYQLVAQTPQLVKLLSFENTVCDMNSDPQRLRNRIIRKSIKQDTLTIEIGAKAICCANFQPIFSFENGVLNLGIQPTGEFCHCDCCYTFIYTIIGLPKNEFSIKFRGKDIEMSDEKYLTFPVKFDVIKGDTVNLFDKYGIRQGLHLRFDEKGRIYGALVYKDDKAISGSSMIKYYQNEKKQSERKFSDSSYTDITYYENGIIKSECTVKYLASGKSLEFCNEYDTNGIKIND